MTTTDTADDLLDVIEYFITSGLSLTPSERLEAIGGAIRDWRQEQQLNGSVEVSEA